MNRPPRPSALLFVLLSGVVFAAQTGPAPAQSTQRVEPASDSVRSSTAIASRAVAPSGTHSSQDSLAASERWRALRSEVTAPILLFASAGPALADYRAGTPSSWRKGVVGYGLRVGSHAGRLLVEAGAAHGLAAATRLDLRFRPRKRGGVGARLRYAALEAATARTPGGTRVPNAPRLVATYGAALAQQHWQSGRMRPVDAVLTTTLALGVDVAMNAIAEFTGGS